MKAKRRDRGAILLALALIAITVALVALAALPRDWFQPPVKAPRPPPVEFIAPDGATAPTPTKAMSVGPEGFGTILSAPPRELQPTAELIGPSPQLFASNAPAIAPALGGLLRLVARIAPVPPSDQLVNFNPEAPGRDVARIILRDGCLRVAAPGEPHLILPAGTRLYVDEQGFLSLGIVSNSRANPRVGELAWWEGFPQPPVSPAVAARIRAQCGPGRVRFLTLAQSVSATQALSDAAAAKTFADRYGAPWRDALRSIQRCRAQMTKNLPSSPSGEPPLLIENMCGSTPPSPVADPRSCPPGTSFSGGLCRTPEGYVRPVPAL